MKIDHLTFAEAVEQLANKFGVQLRCEEGDEPVQRPREPGQRRGWSRRTGWPQSSTPSSWAAPTR